MHPRSWFLAAATAIAALAHAQAAPQPPIPDAPAAPVRPVVDEYFGVRIEDPYRWMEDLKSPEMQAWMKGQAEHTAAVLSRIAGRKRLLARMEEVDAATPARVAMGLLTNSPRRVPGDVWFYQKRGAKDDVEKLYVRHGASGPERLLADPETFRAKTGKPHAINYFEPSPDGKLVAYGISEAGTEGASIYVVDVASGNVVDGPIDRADFGGVFWRPGTRSFFYNRLQALAPGAAPTDKYRDSKAYLHVVGRPAAQDEVILARGAEGVEMTPEDAPFVTTAPGSKWAIAAVVHGVQREWTIYAAPLATVKPGSRWTKIADVADAVVDVTLRGDDLYLLTHANAPRYKVARVRLGGRSPKQEIAVPEGKRVLLGISAARDALYVRARDGATMSLLRLPHRSAKALDVALPGDGILGTPSADPRIDGIVLTVSSWTALPAVFAYEPAAHRMRDTGLQPVGPYSHPAGLAVTHDWATSRDGVRVPLTIVHRTDAPRDGSRRAVLFGYGAYGISQDPRFDPLRLPWFEAGGVWAYCHARGGGEYGHDWYQAGYKKTKPNTWNDAIACGERLVQAGWTAPARLALFGGSAGGILVGRAMEERPDLFAVAIPAVGAMDTLRMESTPNGVTNIPEFGTVKTEEGFRALLEMSSYAHVKDGVAYPATLVLHGANDPRVEPWESAKFAARLQRATSSGKPVLLRIDFESGHGLFDARSQERAELADILTFVLWQTGHPDFQP